MAEIQKRVNLSVDEEITLRDVIVKVKEWINYLVSKWMVLFLVTALGAGAGLLYAFNSSAVYTAETTFVLEDDNAGGGMLSQLGGLASLAGIDGGGGGGLFQGDNIIELYQSRSMVEKTLLSEVEIDGRKQLLINRYIEFNNLRKRWNDNERLKNLSFENTVAGPRARIQDSVLGVIVKNINSKYLLVDKPDKKLSKIRVQVKANDENFAKAFNDQIVKNVNDFYVQTKTKKALENLSALQHQTDSVRNVLNGAVYQAAAIADATPNLNPSRQRLRAPAQRSQFNAEANMAILTQLVQNLELAKLSLRRETPLIQVIDQPVYPLFKEKFGKLKGILIGGIAALVLALFILIARRIYLQAMLQEHADQILGIRTENFDKTFKNKI